MKDLTKRKKVMGRSMRLGHCVCDPKKPCPCDVFRAHDVCLCAGEVLEEGTPKEVRLTRLVEAAGCGSKIDQASLKRILKGLDFPEHPRVLVGVAAGDDAGVYVMSKGRALVQTVDVFSPAVDDAYAFGQIAAANSLSDIYAMGAHPLTALSIISFPVRTVADQVMRDILRGGVEKMTEAGVPVIGGHSIKDPEIKAGFAVTGLIDPRKMTTNCGARRGDVLILTKRIGTGILSFAAQIGRAPKGAVEAITRSMTTLNRTASELMVKAGAHACTDVTGFGLVGHLGEMAQSSGVDVEIAWSSLPIFDGVMKCVDAGMIPGSVERNRESSGHRVKMGKGVTAEMVDVCMDAQTSGGLLIAIGASKADGLLRKLHSAGIEEAAIIGKVKWKGKGKGKGRVHVTRGN